MSGIFRLTKDFNSEGAVINTYIGLNTALIQEGLLKNLPGNQFKVLMAIAAYMNDDGECFPSMLRLKEVTGCSIKTVSDAIQALSKIEIDGKTLITKTSDKNGFNKKNIYNFNLDPLEEAEVKIEADQVEPKKKTRKSKKKTEAAPKESSKEMVAKDYVVLFAEEYEKCFGVKYKPNWARDCNSVKTQLMPTFSEEEIRAIINITVTEYQDNWANPRFKYPTIGAMCSWICNEAMLIHKKRNESTIKTGTRASDSYGLDHIKKSELLW